MFLALTSKAQCKTIINSTCNLTPRPLVTKTLYKYGLNNKSIYNQLTKSILHSNLTRNMSMAPDTINNIIISGFHLKILCKDN